jgi:hypothetical protein
MYQHDHFIVMSSQMLLHVLAYQHHHQGAHMILTSYLYVGVHYKKNNGDSSKLVLLHYGCKWLSLTAVGSSGLLWNTAQGVHWAVFHNIHYEDILYTKMLGVITEYNYLTDVCCTACNVNSSCLSC